MNLLGKNQGMNLTGKSPTETFRVNVNWTQSGVDLDLVGVGVRSNGTSSEVDVAYFQQEQLYGGAVSHSGDVQTGGTEYIDVNTSALPSDVDHIVFGLVAWNVPDLSQGGEATFTIQDGASESATTLATMTASDDDVENETVAIGCVLSRTQSGWQVTNISELRTDFAQGAEALNGFGAAAASYTTGINVTA